MDLSASRETEPLTGAIAPRGRFLGCLLGGAVGDGLGATVQFEIRPAILQIFGPNSIADHVRELPRIEPNHQDL